MINNIQIREYLRKARVLMIISGCHFCSRWKEFIERENLNVPISKRIRVIDCTNSNSLGIIDYNIIKLFDKYMTGNFPFLFFDGMLFNGANSKDECEAFVKGAFNKDYIVPMDNPFMFTKECKFIKKRFGGKRLVCN